MEKYSVLKTPAYAKVNPTLSRHNYSEKSGYQLTYYEPVYDLDLKIPGLGIAQVPFIPIQHTRKNRGKRSFVPRHLTEEDMKQINMKAELKARDVLKDFEPATKATYESSRDFRMKKEIEEKLEDIRDVCADVRDHVRRIKKYDFARNSLTSGASKFKFLDKDKKKDFVLDTYDDHLKLISNNLTKDKNHRREWFKYKSAGCERKEKKKVDEKVEEKDEEKSNHIYKIPQNQTERFESTFGESLSKLRGDLNSLKISSESFIDKTRYKALKADDVIEKYGINKF